MELHDYSGEPVQSSWSRDGVTQPLMCYVTMGRCRGPPAPARFTHLWQSPASLPHLSFLAHDPSPGEKHGTFPGPESKGLDLLREGPASMKGAQSPVSTCLRREESSFNNT